MSVDIRDRTLEYRQTVAQLQATTNDSTIPYSNQNHIIQSNTLYHNNNNNATTSTSTSAIQPDISSQLQTDYDTSMYTKASQFTQAASTITQSIHSITQLLEQLTTCTKQYSLFNDNTSEINDLITTIKSCISHTQTDLNILQDYINSQRGLGGIQNTSNQHSITVVNQLRTQLANTTKDFTLVLKQRTDNLKIQHNRRTQYNSTSANNNNITHKSRRNGMYHINNIQSDVQTELEFSPSHKPHRPSFGIRKRGGVFILMFHHTYNYDVTHTIYLYIIYVSYGMYIGNAFDSLLQNDTQPLLTDDATQQQELSQQQVASQQHDTTNEYLQQRADAVESIESTITQLSQMYQQLVELVGQQEEIVLRIDNNIDDTLVNVESGHSELLKYFDSISGSRWLILKVFTVLIAFIIFFMLFVA